MNTVYGRSYIVSGFWMQVAISTQGAEERNARLSQLIHSNISCAKALKQRYYVVKVVRLQENCLRDGEVHSDKLNKEEQISRHGH